MRNLLLAAVLGWLGSPMAFAAEWNLAVLKAMASMPSGGGYSVSSEASARFRAAVDVSGGRLRVNAGGAAPSYCSSATYLVFLKVVDAARAEGRMRLDAEALAALAPGRQPDGHGIWGRWNANGPGAARLFRELGLGRNFTEFDEALPGDFLKIFWRDAVGSNERGHLVVYLGRETRDGEEWVRFWSSNQDAGYGEKAAPRKKIARALFSRLEHPERAALAARLPEVDGYLAALLERESSFEEACQLSGAGN